jgi:pimeloyl-ACP methyl ester carboxylesterase
MPQTEPARTEQMIGDVAVVDIAPLSTDLPPIVMVHGGLHGAWCWEPLQRLFAAQGWRSVALDWLNHGRSARLPQDEWLKRDIVAVRREVGAVCESVAAETGQAPVLMGHSMGGLAILSHLTLDRPEVTAAVLLAPVVPEGYASGPLDVACDLDEAWERPPLEVARQLFFSGANDEDAQRHYAQLQAESPTAVWQATRWTARLPVDELDGVPILAFGAERDALMPAEIVKNFAEAVGADYVEVAGAGHGLTLDPSHREVFTTTLDWLARI